MPYQIDMVAGMTHPTTLGITGQNFARNLRRIREERGLTYAELSRQLTIQHWPIPVLGLQRIERGDRKVGVDDAMTLALVLGVPLADLLLSDEDDDQVAAAFGLVRGPLPEPEIGRLLEELGDLEARAALIRAQFERTATPAGFRITRKEK
jgi:transcriptional regulator with XRE-family HTH domain